jgi:DNA replication protein DnaC
MFRFRFPADRICIACRESERSTNDERKGMMVFEQACIPHDYRRCRFSNFEPAPGTGTAFRLAQQWSQEMRSTRKPRRGLLLRGPAGGGKTHLAVAVVYEIALACHIPTLFVNVPEWLNNLKDSFDSKGPVLSPREFKLAILDDLGAEQHTEWSRDQIYSLINHREANRLPTIVTTNLSDEVLALRLGTPTMSRLIRLTADVSVDSKIDYRKFLVGAANVAVANG